jgi:hypothetical protein
MMLFLSPAAKKRANAWMVFVLVILGSCSGFASSSRSKSSSKKKAWGTAELSVAFNIEDSFLVAAAVTTTTLVAAFDGSIFREGGATVTAELRADKDVVLAAVAQDGSRLRYAGYEHRADKEVVLAAVTQYGCALIVAADELRADKVVALAAVANNGWALKYAANEHRADKEVVLAAVTQDGSALIFASLTSSGPTRRSRSPPLPTTAGRLSTPRASSGPTKRSRSPP